MSGALLVLGGPVIIARHQYWSGVAAILISLFGWFLAARGIVLLVWPQAIARAGASTVQSMTSVRLGSGALMLAGLWRKWTVCL
jgi:hypothetical protein